MANSSLSLSRGFTLLELAIVLVVIGLVAGGVLIGNDLIYAAKFRAQITQIEKYNTAVGAFKTKYNCLPGDCAEAVNLGLGVSGGSGDNGDGDGVLHVNSVAPINIYGEEITNFWRHLSAANMIDGNFIGYQAGVTPTPGRQSPLLKLEGVGRPISFVTPYFEVRGGVWVMPIHPAMNPVDFEGIGNLWLLSTNVVQNGISGVYTAPTIFALDTKMDNGLPLSGVVRAFTSTIYTPADFWNGAAPGRTCLDNTVDPFIYDMRNKAPTNDSMCSIVIKTAF